MLTFTQALAKYRADQTRDERGRFADEGKGRGRGGGAGAATASRSSRASADGRRAAANARARERRRQRAFEERQRQRAKAPKYREVPRLISNQGARSAEKAIRSAMTRLPQKHYDRLKNLRVFAVKDMADFKNPRGNSIAGDTVASFSPLVGVIVAETLNGRKLLNVETYAMHELAHAMDFFSGFDEGGLSGAYKLSKEMRDDIRAEWAALPASIQFYTEHYKTNHWDRELFAELYSAVYGPSTSAHDFMGVLTRDQVLKAFPKSVAKLRRMAE